MSIVKLNKDLELSKGERALLVALGASIEDRKVIYIMEARLDTDLDVLDLLNNGNWTFYSNLKRFYLANGEETWDPDLREVLQREGTLIPIYYDTIHSDLVLHLNKSDDSGLAGYAFINGKPTDSDMNDLRQFVYDYNYYTNNNMYNIDIKNEFGETVDEEWGSLECALNIGKRYGIDSKAVQNALKKADRV